MQIAVFTIWNQVLETNLGKIFFNLTKGESTRNKTLWRYLSTTDSKVPIWWEMKETYRSAMEEYEKILEEEDDEKEKEEEIIRKKKKLEIDETMTDDLD